jgi:hypothetical protein
LSDLVFIVAAACFELVTTLFQVDDECARHRSGPERAEPAPSILAPVSPSRRRLFMDLRLGALARRARAVFPNG